MDMRVAGRYAKALFLAAQHAGILDGVSDDINGIANAMEAEPKFRKLIENPNVTRAEKMQLLERLFSDRTTALTMGALRLLLEKNRQHEILGVREQFNILKREADRVVLVRITSARPLSNEHKSAVIDKIERATGRQVEATIEMDPALIGGIKVEYDGYVMNGTVSGSLGRLREKLVYDLLKQG
ncbi:MAG: ATP synthase F1 subunit delta [Chthonomonas sp.]|nr:ATP synthase F1 subunit delta [Chthonomonas sp.]